MISSLRREVAENCALLSYYATRSGNSLPTFRDNFSVLFSRVKNTKFLTLENGIDRLYRNVGQKLLLLVCVIAQKGAVLKIAFIFAYITKMPSSKKKPDFSGQHNL